MTKGIKRILATLMSMALIMSLCMGSVVLADDVTIDTSKKGSITIHKYDLTAATNANVDTSGFVSDGKKNSAAEDALKKYAIKGVEFTYLKVGDVIQDNDNGTVKLMYEIPADLQMVLGLSDNDKKTVNGKDYFTSGKISKALSDALIKNTETKNKLEKYITSGTAMEQTSAEGITSKNNLDLGLYLIVETKVPEDVVSTTDPFFVSVPMTDSDGESWFYDIDLYPKNQTGNPTLKKKVRNNTDTVNVVTELASDSFISDREEYKYQDTVTATEGETLDYYLLSKMPHITSTATYLTTYSFNDKMSKGITYGKDAVVAIYDSEDGINDVNVSNVDESGAVAVWKKADGKFNTTYDDENNTMDVVITAEGLKEINEKYSDKYIAVFYTATVNSNASVVTGDKGNPNDVVLTWKRTSDRYYDILTDECIVYTYGLNMTKEFEDNAGDATKVKFVVKNITDGYYVIATGSDGVYYVTGRTVNQSDATVFSPTASGTLKINGIEADEYTITETATDKGYSLLKDSINVKINSTKATITPTEANITGTQSKTVVTVANDGIVQGKTLNDNVTVDTRSASATVDQEKSNMKESSDNADSANAEVVLKVVNEKSFNIPQTGRAGIYIFTFLGAMAIVFGLIIGKGKEKSEE